LKEEVQMHQQNLSMPKSNRLGPSSEGGKNFPFPVPTVKSLCVKGMLPGFLD
jgi:hypothetical protein